MLQERAHWLIINIIAKLHIFQAFSWTFFVKLSQKISDSNKMIIMFDIGKNNSMCDLIRRNCYLFLKNTKDFTSVKVWYFIQFKLII